MITHISGGAKNVSINMQLVPFSKQKIVLTTKILSMSYLLNPLGLVVNTGGVGDVVVDDVVDDVVGTIHSKFLL